MKWNCYGKVIGTKYLGQVEAATEEEAMRLAEDLDSNHISMCHHCSVQISDPEIDEISVEQTGA